MTQAELDTFLEKAADLLRGGVDHSEFRGYVFALLFYKRISDVYVENVAALEAELGDPDLARDPRMHDFVVPEDSLWQSAAHTTQRELGPSLNDAMRAIERANEPKFDGILANSTVDFNAQDRLPRTKLLELINHFSSLPLGRASASDDVFGNAYEYLIRNFASHAGRSSGEFYTPKEVAMLMAEIIEPEPGHHVCDWAAGSGGLLLQCRNYVQRRFGSRESDRLFFYMQESNPSTANIARINMFLHGVRSFRQAPALDSLRTPYFREGETRRLRQFDRILMNPPFSLESWGYDDFAPGDPYGRFVFGLPPRDNGDYAWIQQVVRSLKSTGRAIVVMSQGVLFRGQPEQTQAEDGRRQRADAEYLIREGLVKADLIECVIVLPGKLFYGNTVPGCLVVLNKRKPQDRQGRILAIWASRDFQPANPQNLLRRSDRLRILAAWRAFGDIDRGATLISELEDQFTSEIERERDAGLHDIETAYAPLLAGVPTLASEFTQRKMIAQEVRPAGKDERARFNATKKANADRLKVIGRSLKALERVQAEADEACASWLRRSEVEMTELRETITELGAVYGDPKAAHRHFSVITAEQLVANEFNLNASRYVNSYDEHADWEWEGSVREFKNAEDGRDSAVASLRAALAGLTAPGQ